MILGISLGTRSLGLAVRSSHHLVDWKVRTFKDHLSEKKIQAIVEYLRKEIRRNRITVMAMKLPHPIRSSVWLNQLLSEIRLMAKEKKVLLNVYTIADLKVVCGNAANKTELVEYITAKYPEVRHQYELQKNAKNDYYVKMFEAITTSEIENLKGN